MDRGGLRTEIGRRLRALRETKGFTLEDVASRVGLHYTYLGSSERGQKNLTLDTLERILTALDAEPYEVFSVAVTKGDAEKAADIEVIGNLIARMTPEARLLYEALGKELAGKRSVRDRKV